LSTLTKIFVVLMVIFSIAFTMSTIGFVAKTNKWSELAKGYRESAQVAQTHMRNLAAAHAAEKAVWVDSKRALESQRSQLEAKVAELTTELDVAGESTAALRTEKSNAVARSDQLLSELKIAQAGWREQRDQRAETEKRNLELEERNAELNRRIQEQMAQILVLVQEQRQLEQQINIMREEGTKMAGGAWSGGPAGLPAVSVSASSPATAPTSVAPIRGAIVEVDGKLATISVGSSDGVRDGMVFVIYRGKEYIGDLEVTDVEPNLAAGNLVRMRATPRPSDQVADEPALGLAQ
jgi:hypothetical protein